LSSITVEPKKSQISVWKQWYGSTLSLTLALDGGGWPMSCLWEIDQVPVVQEVGCVPWPVWMVWKIFPPPGFGPWTMQPVVSHYTYYTVPVHHQSLLPVTNPTLLLVTRVQAQMFPVKNSLVLSLICNASVLADG